MIINSGVEKLKHQSKSDFKGRQFEAGLIVKAVTWYLRYPFSYRDLDEMFIERGFEVDHCTINRWVLVFSAVGMSINRVNYLGTSSDFSGLTNHKDSALRG